MERKESRDASARSGELFKDGNIVWAQRAAAECAFWPALGEEFSGVNYGIVTNETIT
jgi:hypothetical protein